MALSPLKDATQPVDTEEEGRSSTMDKRWLIEKKKKKEICTLSLSSYRIRYFSKGHSSKQGEQFLVISQVFSSALVNALIGWPTFTGSTRLAAASVVSRFFRKMTDRKRWESSLLTETSMSTAIAVRWVLLLHISMTGQLSGVVQVSWPVSGVVQVP